MFISHMELTDCDYILKVYRSLWIIFNWIGYLCWEKNIIPAHSLLYVEEKVFSSNAHNNAEEVITFSIYGKKMRGVHSYLSPPARRVNVVVPIWVGYAVEGVNSGMVYLIHCKNLCKFYNVPPASTTTIIIIIKELALCSRLVQRMTTCCLVLNLIDNKGVSEALNCIP
jgi:hypothetical protein